LERLLTFTALDGFISRMIENSLNKSSLLLLHCQEFRRGKKQKEEYRIESVEKNSISSVISFVFIV
jgi:hypothetical protein